LARGERPIVIVGSKLGSYQITAKLGEGGMGEVYRATDTKLRREVAIKVLPAAFTEDKERLARFEREAQLLAQLHHPNIASIFGLEESDGTRALVMELVEGPTLAERLEQGPLPFNECLSVSVQIAQALEEAHEKGIIHRDLKPQNIKASIDGKVKVLDFGLAKAMDPLSAGSGSASQLAQSPTLTLGATMQGVILGTAAYMSPEQAKGSPVDKRADIWAFGVVLYEMLTGARLFVGDSVPETLAGVLKSEIDWTRLPETTPVRVRRLLERCLVRDRRQRLHDIGDARLELEDASSLAPDGATSTPAAPARSRAAVVAAAALVVGALLGALTWRTIGGKSAAPAASSTTRLSIVPPPGQQLLAADISPDGQTVALMLRPRGDRASRPRLYLRRLGRFDPEPVAESDGTSGFGFSPDSRWLYFVAPVAAGAPQRRIARAPVEGNAAPVTVRRWDDNWGTSTVLANGDILVATIGGDTYLRLPANGADPEPARPFEGGALAGSFFNFEDEQLSDGSPLLRVSHYGSRGYQNGVAALDLATGKVRLLIDDAFRGVLLPGGKLLFGRGDALLVAPFDSAKQAVTDAPRSILTGARTTDLGEPYPRFRVAKNGTLIYFPGTRVGVGRRLVTVDAQGKVAPWSSDRRPLLSEISASTSGRVALTAMTADGMLYELWIADPESPGLRRLVTTPGIDNHLPVLSRDGTHLAFRRSGRSPQDGLYVRAVEGAPDERRLAAITPASNFYPIDWSPDGKLLLAGHATDGKVDIVAFAPEQSPAAEPRPLLASSDNETDATFSPDGRALAFVSYESGRSEIYLAPFRADGSVGPAVEVSGGPGVSPHWRPDGKALYFWDGQDHIFSVAITTSPRISAGVPEIQLDLPKLGLTEGFAVLPDGRLLVVALGEEEGEIPRLDLVLGFTSELARAGGEP